MSANPRQTESFAKVTNSLLNELITRDFSKRQLKIIYFIIRLSWGCGKEFAVIPNFTKSFTTCGVPKQAIRAELEYLTRNNIITWNEQLNLFELNKNFDEWNTAYNRFYEPDLLSKLIHLNLKNMNIVNEMRRKSFELDDNVTEYGVLYDGCKPKPELNRGKSIDSIIDNIIEDKSLTLLKSIKNYPFDRQKDVSMLYKLAETHPSVDMVACLEDWSVYKLDNPIGKHDSPRHQIHSWFRNSEQWGKNLKRKLTDLEIVNQKIARGEL